MNLFVRTCSEVLRVPRFNGATKMKLYKIVIHQIKKQNKKHTTVGIRWWSPTQLLIHRSEACVWQSGRDAQFSSVYGRMWKKVLCLKVYSVFWQSKSGLD
ncbi:hypothetical protein BofuT4_P123830.1 [Botrytis cinerea T4]|uniref:Uncharacterized protein n=1 Tax=Botryotinia fuckeliana (strain T4) TaxID=999810 RepID=G2YP16_BOTF4|nr:hypothetical protein BofuT4_P123830.1 [Botrytis cinerea T4]